MYSSAFPSCCGAIVFSHFGNTRTANPDNWVKFTEQQVDDWLKDTLPEKDKYGLITAILNEDQKKLFHNVLKKHGFKLKGNGLNQGHMTRLFFYLKENNPSRPIRRKANDRAVQAR